MNNLHDIRSQELPKIFDQWGLEWSIGGARGLGAPIIGTPISHFIGGSEYLKKNKNKKNIGGQRYNGHIGVFCA